MFDELISFFTECWATLDTVLDQSEAKSVNWHTSTTIILYKYQKSEIDRNNQCLFLISLTLFL